MNIEKKLKSLGIIIDDPPRPLGSYRPSVVSGNLLFISGQLPIKDGKLLFEGKVGSDVSLEQAIKASRQCAINSLSIIKDATGDLSRVERIVKVTGYVACSKSFYDQASVINGASDLYYEVFGRKGVHARAVTGVPGLPMNSPVEVEIIAELND